MNLPFFLFFTLPYGRLPEILAGLHLLAFVILLLKRFVILIT